MKKPVAIILFVLSLIMAGGLVFSTADEVAPPEHIKTAQAVVIDCKGMIDDGLYKSIQRRTDLAIKGGADYLIYQIETYGGFLDSGDNISKYFILDVAKRAHTVAYVTTEAISAGAMISVSCQDIIMMENTTIGDCAPIALGGKLEGVEREKTESFVRATFMRAAEANKYPKPLLKAMVTVGTEVYRVKNLQTGDYEFYETPQLPKDANAYDLDNKQLIVSSTELLTLTASKAAEYGIARSVVNDVNGVLAYLAKRDDVEFTQAPGVWLPGLVAVICFAIIIGSKFLIGLANWVEIALFLLGVLLIMVEIFLIPGFGVIGFAGIIFVLAGLFGMLIKNPPGRLPWPETDFDWQWFIYEVWALGLGFLGFLVLAGVLSRYLPKSKLFSGLVLSPKAGFGATEVNMTAPPEAGQISVKVGQIGEAMSRLRPAGKAKFGEAVVDVVSEGQFIDKEAKVTIIEISGNRVVVRQA